MTVSEALQIQRRRGRVIMNAVGLVPVVIFVVPFFVRVSQHTQQAVIAWFLGTAAGAIAIWYIVGWRLRCPICRANVARAMTAGGLLRACPHCGADFSQPMPGK